MGTRTIESQRFVSGRATFKLLLIETGKKLPFRVRCEHEVEGKPKTLGYLALSPAEDEARELYEDHVKQAKELGWEDALPGRVQLLPGIPPPPGSVPASGEPAAPVKRRPGRPRKRA